jgi:hypothetical protein
MHFFAKAALIDTGLTIAGGVNRFASIKAPALAALKH